MTMDATPSCLTRLFEQISSHLDLPKSYYEKASQRHRSVSNWMNRPQSTLAAFHPEVRPQGSFRYGTVIPPLDPSEDYDLDNVCLLTGIHVTDITQADLKSAYGAELAAYGKCHDMREAPEEHNRCWRLQYQDEVYQDEVGFHLDSLPCIPVPLQFSQALEASGIVQRFASTAAYITDKKHPKYWTISDDWPVSNPRGFARWFESKAVLGRPTVISQLGRSDDQEIPAYEWKTSLQRSIQLLKRHRDVMFRSTRELAPISMVITNLAAHAYNGDRDLGRALRHIVEEMPKFIRSIPPRVPNPTLPAEDYADKWARDPDLERNFWLWHAAVVGDLSRLEEAINSAKLEECVERVFAVELTEAQLRDLNPYIPKVRISAPAIIVSSAPKPWGHAHFIR
jgi:hypothetical protein